MTVEELASHTHYGLWGWGSAEISDPPDAANQLNLGNRTWSQPMTSTGGGASTWAGNLIFTTHAGP